MPSQKRPVTVEVPRDWGCTKAANQLLWARANRLVNALNAATSRDEAKVAVQTYLVNLRKAPIEFSGLTMSRAVGFAAEVTQSPKFVASCIESLA